MIAATWRTGIGRVPVRHFPTCGRATPNSCAKHLLDTPDRDIRERNSAEVIAAVFTRNRAAIKWPLPGRPMADPRPSVTTRNRAAIQCTVTEPDTARLPGLRARYRPVRSWRGSSPGSRLTPHSTRRRPPNAHCRTGRWQTTPQQTSDGRPADDRARQLTALLLVQSPHRRSTHSFDADPPCLPHRQETASPCRAVPHARYMNISSLVELERRSGL